MLFWWTYCRRASQPTHEMLSFPAPTETDTPYTESGGTPPETDVGRSGSSSFTYCRYCVAKRSMPSPIPCALRSFLHTTASPIDQILRAHMLGWKQSAHSQVRERRDEETADKERAMRLTLAVTKIQALWRAHDRRRVRNERKRT